MRRDQLEHAIRTACQVIGRNEVIVVGSQSILGTFREDQLPADATMSVEIDILPIADDNAETERLADLIEGVAGEFSPFEGQCTTECSNRYGRRALCCRFRRVRAALFVIVLGAAEEVAQPLESLASCLVRYLRVDLHRHGDLAVPKNRHRDARVNFERGE
jgi:hypothetical protein